MNAPFEYDRSRAMKQTDFTPCVGCGKGVMHTGLPLCYRVTIERMGIDGRAVQRQAGLEMMLGGHAKIANVMGPDEDMGLPIGPTLRGLLCETCANSPGTFFGLIVESLNDAKAA
jgi:hypothetical protein